MCLCKFRHVGTSAATQNIGPADNRDVPSRKTSIREAAIVAPLSPAAIDNSIDNSVKSAQAGKEVCSGIRVHLRILVSF